MKKRGLYTGIWSQILLLGLLPLFISCSDDEPDCTDEPYPLIEEVVLFSLRNPQAFTEFVSLNENELDAQFQECMQQRIAEIQELADQALEECDANFESGSDLWSECRESAELHYAQSITLMEDILRTIDGMSFTQTEMGFNILVYQQVDTDLYEDIFNFNEMILSRVDGTCQFCE